MSRSLTRKLLIGTALFTLFAVSMISSVSATTKKNAILNFVNGCFLTQDGYYGTPDASPPDETTLDSTYAALSIIGILKSPLDADTYENEYDIQIFLTGIANTTHGGYRNIEGGTENILSTYQALYLANALDINISSSMNKHAEFVLDSQNVNGGFGSSPQTNSSPDIINTYYALKALSITGNASQINKSLVHSFVMTCREGGTMFAGTSNSTDVSIMATYYAVRLFKDFLAPTYTDIEGTYIAMRSFIAGHLGSAGGFADPASGTEPLLSSTYYAVALCRDIGVDIPGGDDKAVIWILSKQDFDGGFIEGSSPVATSSMVATNLAVSAIHRIRPTLSDLDTDTAWTLTQVAGIVAAVVLIVGIIVLVVVIYYVRKRNRI